MFSNNGHIQSLLNPPGNPKALFWARAEGSDAEEWLATAAKERQLVAALARVDQGARGRDDAAPAGLGGRHPPLGDAPGRYVMEK